MGSRSRKGHGTPRSRFAELRGVAIPGRHSPRSNWESTTDDRLRYRLVFCHENTGNSSPAPVLHRTELLFCGSTAPPMESHTALLERHHRTYQRPEETFQI